MTTNPKGVLVRLSLIEAKALSHAAGNSTTDPDFLLEFYPSGRERNAALRAQRKLDDAIVAATVAAVFSRERR